MKKRFFSILLSFCMVLGLLPVMAFAADPEVTIGTTTLADGMYYTIITGDDDGFALVVETTDEPPTDTPYLSFSDGVLTVSGDVSLTSGGPNPLSISNGELVIAGSGSLSLSSSIGPAVNMNNSSLSLSESVDFSAEQTSTNPIPAITNGSVETEEGYSGNITISSTASSALFETLVNLQTSGDISISGGGFVSVIATSGTVTLEGESVSVSSRTNNGMLVDAVSNPENTDETAISITATKSDLSLTGASDTPLLAAHNITLSANGNIQVENTGNVTNSSAIYGNLTVTKAQDVTVSSSKAQAITGTANITATGDVAISSTNNYAVGGLTVNGANDVTVIANESPAPAICANAADVAINASGNINIENTGDGMAIAAVNVSIDTTGGSISILSEGEAPVINANTAVTLKAKGNIEVTGSNSVAAIYGEGVTPTLISERGVVKLTDKNGNSTSITLADGSTISAADGGDASAGLDLVTATPVVDTYYPAGNGYALWKDVTGNATDGYTGTLVLHNATIENTTELIGGVGIGAEQMGIALPKGSITLQVEDENNISSKHGYGIGVKVGNIILSGDGTLNASGGKEGIILDTGYTLSFGNSDVKLNGIVTISDEGASARTVYGDVTVPSGLYLTGDVTIATGATLTIPEGTSLSLENTNSVTNNGQIINNGEIQLPYSYNVAQIQALHISGSGKIRLYDSVNNSYYIYIDNNIYLDAGPSGSNTFTLLLPDEPAYMDVNDGYLTVAPAVGETPATLNLHDVVLTSLTLPNAPLVLSLEGENEIFQIKAYNAITVTGSGSLDTYLFENDDATAALTVNSGAKLNTRYETVDAGVTTTTIYGSFTVSDYYGLIVSPTAKVVLTSGAVLTLAEEGYLEFKQNAFHSDLTIGTGASIVNNTYIILPEGTTVAQIQALPLSGTGVVRVATAYSAEGWANAWDSYTNDGVAVKEIIGDLDLSVGGHSNATVADDGYAWDDVTNTLTLGDVVVSGGLTLPNNTTINTTSGSTISGNISGASGNYAHIVFSGSAPLNINGIIALGANGDSVTVQDGAQVTVNGVFSLGVYDGILNVSGSGTVLNLSAQQGYAVLCGEVNVGNGASLNVGSQGDGSRGIEAHGNVNVTGGSTLTAGCDYGVYIIDGTLTVDSSSKLITNGTVAPFCVVDTSSNKEQNEVINLPGLPSGTKITSEQGNDLGFGYTYWSLVPTNGSLSVTNEDPSPANLIGAVKGLLTFKKASSNSGGSSGGGGGVSLTRTLTFKTNGGSDIASVTKTNGVVVDLKDYKPTREGYTFAGWYSDEALTKKITSVTLTASTTVYAKWTELTEKTEETKETKNPFTDVKDSDYFYDAVQWAVEKDITSGTTSSTFGPSMICTRAQMVTFLWRAMGSPEPTAANCSFTDVSKDAYYYKAVLWAVEKGITAGTTATTFSPNATVTRGQTVTFLWRGAGKPMASITNPYTDVAKDAYNYDAILWAAEKGITQGTTSTTFSPDTPCTRGQIVSFLYRYMGK
ncbi:endoglucanase precursor [Anaerotignum neopropionicum]|uniref:Endoglucanase n=1 Tax=Anaerotignum neopropionicum TaxID=36847 RepID=A0A136WEM9_9FIRM|nr:S-layer homology domain-containing protein [Anaerotignum neopropionicum]KXL52976.1 endoglucanase precursor [Anaerotignum neopropionicum]